MRGLRRSSTRSIEAIPAFDDGCFTRPRDRELPGVSFSPSPHGREGLEKLFASQGHIQQPLELPD